MRPMKYTEAIGLALVIAAVLGSSASTVLERAADADVLDTTPGKRAFLRYGAGLSGTDDDKRAG